MMIVKEIKSKKSKQFFSWRGITKPEKTMKVNR